MGEREPNPQITAFLERLATLDPGDRARLKRNAGCSLAEARDALGLFYRILPWGVPAYHEETYFLVGTLYPLAEAGPHGDLGAALRRARPAKNAKGVDRRVEVLLDADEAQLPFRLRQSIHWLQSNRVAVDWATLLDDLLKWSHPSRAVQRRWAKSYFAVEDSAN